MKRGKTSPHDGRDQEAVLDSFYSAYNSLFSNAIAQVGYSVEIASRLLSTDLTISNPETVAEAMLTVDGGVGMKWV